ncbi:MAG: BON domain-containing protein [bacterium]|jgi:hyperosmotically inducible protein
MKRQIANLLAVAVAGATLLAASTTAPNAPRTQERLEKEVRKELLTLPFLSVFDNLSYRIEGETAYLSGQTIRPVLKSDAANRVRSLEGITNVVNEIEVLPLSPFDDRLRLLLARTIYGQPALQRYALGANPSIRIIVRNGNVTLEGVVDREMDKTIAGLRANTVDNVFGVTNNLRIAAR